MSVAGDIMKMLSEDSGGSGGTTNYNSLSNKPQIGGVTLSGNKSASDLGLVEAVEGKGLSTNDYTDSDKATVTNAAAVIPETASASNKLATAADIPSSGDIVESATGADLVITDAAGGYVQSLTIKGNSEVVDGAIKSIGDAGWGKVDLGTLTWEYLSEYQTFVAAFDIPFATKKGGFCTKYDYVISGNYLVDKSFSLTYVVDRQVAVKDLDYTDAAVFKSAMSGVIVYYPLSDTTGTTPIVGIISKDGAGQGTAATITTGLPLRSVSDSITDEADNEKIVTRCNEIDLGSLHWEIYSSEKNIFYSDVISDATNGVCISTKYTYSSVTPAELADNNYTLFSNKRLYIRDANYTDPTVFATSLAGVRLVYPLETPIETPLTSAEKAALAALRTYSGTTSISATDSPLLVIDYFKNTDNGKAVANVENRCSLKYVTWRGTGTSTNSNIHFLKKPTLVLSIQFTNKPSSSIATMPFAYGAPSVYVSWSSGAGTYSGSYNSSLSYSEDGLTMTIRGSDKGSALNDETTDYILYYI